VSYLSYGFPLYPFVMLKAEGDNPNKSNFILHFEWLCSYVSEKKQKLLAIRNLPQLSEWHSGLVIYQNIKTNLETLNKGGLL